MSAAASAFLSAFRGVGGGKWIAVVISAYFDESSEEDSQNGLLAVCGYAFDDTGAAGLIPEWRKMLADYRLPYFHTNECNACDGIFEHLTDTECDDCAREAIRIARKYPLHGHAMALDQSEYRQILQDEGFECDPYSFMVWGQFIQVNKWVGVNLPDERISLFFECGYKTQKRASELLQVSLSDPWSGKNRTVSCTFVKKEDSEPTQAADLAAWQIRKGYENLRHGKRVRKDTWALIEGRSTKTIEYTGDLLRSIRDNFLRSHGSLEEASRQLFSYPPLVQD